MPATVMAGALADGNMLLPHMIPNTKTMSKWDHQLPTFHWHSYKTEGLGSSEKTGYVGVGCI